MPPFIDLLGQRIDSSVYIPLGSLLFMVLWMSLWLAVKSVVFSWLRGISSKTATRVDDLLIAALNFPIVLMILASGVLVLLRIGVSTQYISHDQLYRVLLVVGVIGVVFFCDRMLRGAITVYADKVELFRVAGGLVQSIARGLVLVIGLLVLLGTLGINITPIIASLGVGSLAVALALRPTLENFFAGMQVITDRQIMEGQSIKLETGEEGVVEKINMRSTWLRTGAGNMIIFPNTLLVTSRIMNYDYPTREIELAVPLSVNYNSDLTKVERVAIEVAGAIQKEFPGALRSHQPVVRFNLLGESGIACNVIMRAENNTFLGGMRHEFIKNLTARFRAEGIQFAHPIRAFTQPEQLPGAKAS